MKALDCAFDEEAWNALHEVSKIEMGFPHDFLGRPEARKFAFGEQYDHLDNYRAGRIL